MVPVFLEHVIPIMNLWMEKQFMLCLILYIVYAHIMVVELLLHWFSNCKSPLRFLSGDYVLFCFS